MKWLVGKRVIKKDGTPGKLVVVAYSHKSKAGHHYWECKCDCNGEGDGTGHVIVQVSNINSGSVWHCGCEREGKNAFKNVPPARRKANMGLDTEVSGVGVVAGVRPTIPPLINEDVPHVDDNRKIQRRPSAKTRRALAGVK